MKSVEWLFRNLLECPKDKFIWYSYFDKANEMYKLEMGKQELSKDAENTSFDKVILNEATDRYVLEDEIDAFMKGAEWMQEQLKKNYDIKGI